MKKTNLILFIIMMNFCQAQFTVSETSTDWKRIGDAGTVFLYTKDNLLKIKMTDGRNDQKLSDVVNPSRTVFDDIYKNQKKANEGIKSGYYEVIFTSPNQSNEDLYNLIMEKFKEKKVQEITLDFPEGKLYLKFHKDIFQYLFNFGIETNGSIIYSSNLGEAGVRNAFGIKKNKKSEK